MGVAAPVVTLVLLLFVLYQHHYNGGPPERPPTRADEVAAEPDVTITTDPQAHQRRLCDQLCERYDKTHDVDACRQLREECGLPCEIDQLFMDAVYVWVNTSGPLYELEEARIKASLKGWGKARGKRVCLSFVCFVHLTPA